ncbi:hypothetical protein EC973_001093 [Apophysomyces ossiformis]|uniref:Ricin B lectin domain-containing protein n=1 Tax=Apophysomyces ossiformis TaxID=679940 RepID=A0A8H7BMM0_9FUNG|nr:hypothetical protein EC973_001093 [Apophysomyces ossiformis]
MLLNSVLTVLLVSILASAVKIKNTYNGLCLDFPDGYVPGSAIVLADCCDLKHGNWSVVHNTTHISVISNGNPNTAQKLCLDFYTPRTGNNPSLWECNDSTAQFFIRNPNTRPNSVSFMTTYTVQNMLYYQLSVLADDKQGALASFSPVLSSEVGPVRYEWITVG